MIAWTTFISIVERSNATLARATIVDGGGGGLGDETDEIITTVKQGTCGRFTNA
jgi:hypothetical protein